ncbi:hypothetical protein C6P45_000079 [Maudiozyma exigua]|uniref:Uncharacterized protein n=1 Tax=Maudiozyma exigua TaxID=34358 RepID=A0A9P6WF94_MAUEX|nr:hypothetical protein C6P45_000079 [Kazachstania exigua]
MFGSSYNRSLSDLPLFHEIKIQYEKEKEKDKRIKGNLTRDPTSKGPIDESNYSGIRQNSCLHSLNSYNAIKAGPINYPIRNYKGKIDYLSVEIHKENKRRDRLRSLGTKIFKPVGFETKRKSESKDNEIEKPLGQILANSIYDSLWNRTSMNHLSGHGSPFLFQGCTSPSMEHDMSDTENQASNMSLECVDGVGNGNPPGLNFRFHESFHTSHEPVHENVESVRLDNANILGLTIEEEAESKASEESKEEEDAYYDDDDSGSWDEDHAVCYDDDDDV